MDLLCLSLITNSEGKTVIFALNLGNENGFLFEYQQFWGLLLSFPVIF
jgi:hypothetical protein